MSTEFEIIFRGDIVVGHQLHEVKKQLQQLFKVDAGKIDALFTGRPIPLKKNLDEVTANKYREVLLKAGALVEICVASEAGNHRPTASPGSPASLGANPTPASPIKSSWSLAPVGSYLLAPTERPKTNVVSIDTGSISLRPAGGNLLDAGESKMVVVENKVAPDFDLAELGTDLVSENEKIPLPILDVDVTDWGLADIGADLMSPDERPVVATLPITVSNFELAPAGSDLGQLKVEIKPLAPDISRLSLAE